MNDEVMDGVGEEVPAPVQEPVKKTKKVAQAQAQEPTTAPTSTANDGVTLDNFQAKFGKRYRMTKEQKARGLTREQAFEEWKASAK